MKRVVIKVGSNVLTRGDGKLDITRISSITDQIAALRASGCEVILVTSGAVASGRGELKVGAGLDGVEQRQLFSAVGQVKLVNLYYDLFREFHIHVGQVLTTKENFLSKEAYENQRSCMEVMLRSGVLPIVNENDTVSITELMFTDNDELSGLIAGMLHADTLVLLTDVDGLYDGDPSIPGSSLIRVVTPEMDPGIFVSEGKSSNGRGGMVSKCRTGKKIASEGIRVIIARGTRDNVLTDILLGNSDVPHTEFPPVIGGIVLDEPETIDNKDIEKTKAASGRVAALSDAQRCDLLLDIAASIERETPALLEANMEDLCRMDPRNPLYDRLKLTPERLSGIASDMRKVASLPSPLGRTLLERVLPNGLELKRISVPFGVIGVIYEARPNVTFDVVSLCIKSGNACVLKGGKDADNSNRAAINLIGEALKRHGVPREAATLLPSTHEAASRLLGAVGLVDVCIPRGGRKLINYVRDNAKVPVIETGAGVVNTYFDAAGDLMKGIRIVQNAKTRRVSVCNALDCLIIHRSRLSDLPALAAPLAGKEVPGLKTTACPVTIYADDEAYRALDGKYPAEYLFHAKDEHFGTEFMDYILAVKTVGSLDEALSHIARFGSGHSEAIVTEDPQAAERFRNEVDAACVYVNAPTSFTDGGEFGMGAEIGISTQKLGPRGPMALEELTTYKWLIHGEGQVR